MINNMDNDEKKDLSKEEIMEMIKATVAEAVKGALPKSPPEKSDKELMEEIDEILSGLEKTKIPDGEKDELEEFIGKEMNSESLERAIAKAIKKEVGSVKEEFGKNIKKVKEDNAFEGFMRKLSLKIGEATDEEVKAILEHGRNIWSKNPSLRDDIDSIKSIAMQKAISDPRRRNEIEDSYNVIVGGYSNNDNRGQKDDTLDEMENKVVLELGIDPKKFMEVRNEKRMKGEELHAKTQ